jgi:hypothetical protein
VKRTGPDASRCWTCLREGSSAFHQIHYLKMVKLQQAATGDSINLSER